MGLDTNIRGTTGTQAEVTAANELKVFTAGNVNMFTESDAGDVTGTQLVLAPETDDDYRLRISTETYLDQETFNYTAQNTGKHRYFTATMTNAWTVNGLQTNSGNAVASGNATLVQSYAYFPIHGVASTYFQFNIGFNQATFPTNTNINFGAFITPATAAAPTAPYTPADGVYFQATASGLVGVLNFNGTETATALFLDSFGGSTWTPTINQRYNFCITVNERDVQFWIDNVLYGTLTTPFAQGQPFISSSLPVAFQHALTGAPNANFSMFVSDMTVSIGGPNIADRLSTIGNRTLGSYQGLSGGTMGTLANYANSANPTAAVPTNTSAALGTGLGGQFWETATLALNTDGIICSYQNPWGTTTVQGKRLVIRGIGLTSYIQTVIAGGPFVAQYSLAFGNTLVTMAGADSPTGKVSRRVPLAAFTQVVTAAQAVSTIVSQPGGSFMDFGDAPIYVNPGEFIALVTKHVGTVGTSGTIAHVVSFVYGWE